MIFPIVWILLFVDGVNAAAIFTIAVRMIHLGLARLQETSPKLRDAVGSTNIDVKSIELMIDALPRF